MENQTLKNAIRALKESKNAVILAHYYQTPEIQEVADFVGDSLALAQSAASTNSEIIVFAGVHFMAETAKIINPDKKVLLPDLEASCSLAESCPPEAFRAFKKERPDHVVVSYINCSAEVKSMSDYVCTSSNAKKVIDSIPMNQKIIFGPDKNLGKYLQKVTGREMVIWDGACIVHEAFAKDKILALLAKHPKAELVAHPESEATILEMANFIGSTSAMINYVNSSDTDVFIIATEVGILHEMRKKSPDKLLIPAPVSVDNTCACSECPYMKMNTLEKLYECLKFETPEIIISDELRELALPPITRMLSLS